MKMQTLTFKKQHNKIFLLIVTLTSKAFFQHSVHNYHTCWTLEEQLSNIFLLNCVVTDWQTII